MHFIFVMCLIKVCQRINLWKLFNQMLTIYSSTCFQLSFMPILLLTMPSWGLLCYSKHQTLFCLHLIQSLSRIQQNLPFLLLIILSFLDFHHTYAYFLLSSLLLSLSLCGPYFSERPLSCWIHLYTVSIFSNVHINY